MPKCGVIFDLDGTLVDSLGDIASAGNAVLARYGRPPFKPDDYRRFIGKGIGVLVRRAWGVADDAEDPELSGLIREVGEYYSAHCIDQTRPYEGVVGMLDELRRQEFSLSILSNKPDAMTQTVVSELFGPNTFESVAGERRGIPRKPDPAGALRAAAFMGIDPARCVFVGDLSVDVETGKAAGMQAVAVSWGFGDRSALVATEPDAVASRPLDVLRFCEAMC